MTGGKVIDELVNLQGGHALVNMGCHMIQHGGIQFSGLADAFYLLGGLDKAGTGHQLALGLRLKNPEVHLRGGDARRQYPAWFFLLLLLLHTNIFL